MTSNAERPRSTRPAPVRRRNNWEFLVPDPSGARPYLSRTFTDRRTGELWQIDSYVAIAAGQPIPDADVYRTGARRAATGQRPSPRTQARVGEVALAWWRLTYEDEPMSSPSRRTSTLTHIERHIAPWFDSRIDDISQLTFDLATEFMRYLAGHDLDPAELAASQRPVDAEWFSVADAAAASGVHVSSIKRAIATGRLPSQREVRNGETVRGTIRVASGDLLAAGLTLHGQQSDGRIRKGLSPDYCNEILNTLRRITRLARSRGQMLHDPLEGVKVSKTRPSVANKKPNRTRERALTWQEIRTLAAELNIHHQVALWLQRVLGLRISEAFGLRLADILDIGEQGLVIVQSQGGRAFERRDDNGEIERLQHTEIMKTSASYRVLGVPQPLMDLLRVYVDAFHRDLSTGEVDPNSRLVLGMRTKDEGGQQAYREAFMSAAARHHLDHDHLGFHIVTQLLRKSISVELHAYVDITEHTRSRFLGHAYRAHDGGAQMTAASYTPDMVDLRPFLVAAGGIADLIRSQIGDLFVPPGAFSTPSRSNSDESRAAHVRQVLEDSGWSAAPHGVDLTEAAETLGISLQSLQHQIRQGSVKAHGVIGPAGQRRRVIPDDQFEELLDELLAHADESPQQPRSRTGTARAARMHQSALPDDVVTVARLAKKLGLDYTTVYQWIGSGRIRVEREDTTGALIVDPDDVERELADVERVRQLQQRSVIVAEACARIGCGHSMVHYWLRKGRLERDDETDQNGLTYVTRDSVERVAAERSRTQPPGAQSCAPPHQNDGLISLADVQVPGARSADEEDLPAENGKPVQRDPGGEVSTGHDAPRRSLAEGGGR